MRQEILFRNPTIISGGMAREVPFWAARNGRIAGEIPEAQAKCWQGEIREAEGTYLMPGFVDIHVHGGGGYDFMDGTPEAVRGVCLAHARHGTTALLATTLAAREEETMAFLDAFRQAKAEPAGTKLLGIHLEGPYFSAAQRGAQDPAYLRRPSKPQYLAILEAARGNVLRWSAAPELPGALEFGDTLSQLGVAVSIGHSDATGAQVQEAVWHGFSQVTHLYSGMSMVHRENGFRVSGVVEAAFLLEALSVEVIADGCHLPPDMLRMIYRIKGPGKTAMITDAMRAAGQTCTESFLGSRENGQRVVIADGVAKLPDGTAFAGSVATADRLLRTAVNAGIPLPHAVQMLTQTPARMAGKFPLAGTLRTGSAADFVWMDQALQIREVYIDGNPVLCPIHASRC